MSDPIAARIDADLARLPELQDGLGAYAAMIDRFERAMTSDPAGARRKLERDWVGLAVRRYLRATGDVPLWQFSDGANQCVFDGTHERTVAMWGTSRMVAPNSRDDSYHAGYPRAATGYDKGHAIGHALGGVEGGPNYFEQDRMLNQSRSAKGKLWRSIETYLASNAGLPAFVRLIYARSDRGARPAEVEYCLLNRRSQFRAVVFPN